MPRMGPEIYAAHMDNVMKLAKQDGGVSKPQLMKELNVTRAIATGLIDKCGLVRGEKKGKTEFFVAPETKQKVGEPSLPPEVEEAASPVSDDTGNPKSVDDQVQELDQEIFETLDALRAASEKCGKHMAAWSSQLALVEAGRQRMTELTVRRARLLDLE